MEVLAVSINDAAKVLGLGRTSIYSMIADGRLVAFKLGRRRLVKQSDGALHPARASRILLWLAQEPG
jgi:excisionase family DNA binding protein